MNDSPFKGALGTVTCFVTGTLLRLDQTLQADINFWLSSLAFVATIISVIHSIYRAQKKSKKS